MLQSFLAEVRAFLFEATKNNLKGKQFVVTSVILINSLVVSAGWQCGTNEENSQVQS